MSQPLSTQRLRPNKRSERVFDLATAESAVPLVRQILSNPTECQDELSALGISLLDASAGICGFPTLVNGSLAYFVYPISSDTIDHWRYRNEAKPRLIPNHWREGRLPADTTSRHEYSGQLA